MLLRRFPGHELIGLVLMSSLHSAEPTLKLDLGNQVTLDLILVQPGRFQQGSPSSEVGRSPDESEHLVTLTKPFYLSKHPVTRAQFERFVQETGYRTEAEQGTSGGFGWDGGKLVQRKDYNWRSPGFAQDGSHPVTLVTWFDARKYIDWLSRKTGRSFALPTEAQWEYACRAGGTGPFPDTGSEELVWHAGNSPGGTQPVGRKKANAWGIHEMQGNVWEWCEDWYAAYPAGDVTDPVQANDQLSDKPRRVLRGGSFTKGLDACRAAKRYRNDPRSRNADNGFRVLTMTVDIPLPVLEKPDETVKPRDESRAATPDFPPLAPEPTPRAPAAQPPPASPFSPPLADANGPSGSGPGGLIVLLLIVVAGALLLRAVLRAARGTGGPQLSRSSSAGTVNDGFWLRSNAPRGSTVRWRCRIGNQWREGNVVYNPGPQGHFIFTGGIPEEVDFKTVGLAAGMIAETTGDDLTPRSRPLPTPPPLPPRDRGRPRAYE